MYLHPFLLRDYLAGTKYFNDFFFFYDFKVNQCYSSASRPLRFFFKPLTLPEVSSPVCVYSPTQFQDFQPTQLDKNIDMWLCVMHWSCYSLVTCGLHLSICLWLWKNKMAAQRYAKYATTMTWKYLYLYTFVVGLWGTGRRQSSDGDALHTVCSSSWGDRWCVAVCEKVCLDVIHYVKDEDESKALTGYNIYRAP